MFKALNGILCTDGPLRNYSLTHSLKIKECVVNNITLASEHGWTKSSISKCSFRQTQSRGQQLESSHVQDELFNSSLPLTNEHRRAARSIRC